jgi:glutamate/tyrosine decarboxylase-like PLP-dependent enzyme
MANFVGFLTGRRMKAPWNIRSGGLRAGGGDLRAYVSRETHTWVQKAADLFGLGTESICWVATDAELRMDLDDLQRQIVADRAAGKVPFLVVGTGGTVGTGAVDPLPEIASLCRENDLWFHVDGAYGAVAAVLPEAPQDLRGLAEADSVALDPHKWLYSAAEAGCVLVRDQQWLIDTFSYRPEYYQFEERDSPINYFELGPQNSRNFRALKVWLALRQAGRAGYEQMVRDDIALARAMHAAVDAHPELEARTCNLSIVTFRYVPSGLSPGDEPAEAYLNELNRVLVDRLQVGGELFVSNYIIDGAYLLRACITNFRTTLADVEALPEIVARVGGELDREMRPEELQ